MAQKGKLSSEGEGRRPKVRSPLKCGLIPHSPISKKTRKRVEAKTERDLKLHKKPNFEP